MARHVGTLGTGGWGATRHGWLATSLLVVFLSCERREGLTQTSAPTAPVVPVVATAVLAQLPSSTPNIPQRTTRRFGRFQVTQESRPDTDAWLGRWDHVQVFQGRQRLLDVTSTVIGPNITVHPATGRDITGDGVPEIVLQSWSGGNHAGDDLLIYAVAPTVHRLARVDGYGCTVDLADLDGDGVLEVLSCDPLPDVPAAGVMQCSEAERPSPTVIYRFDALTNQYRLATPDYAAWRRDALMRSAIAAEQRLPAEPCALYAAAIDVLYGGDRQGAERLLQRLPPAECVGDADCAERAARLFAGLRTELWDALRRSARYLARSAPHAPVLSK